MSKLTKRINNNVLFIELILLETLIVVMPISIVLSDFIFIRNLLTMCILLLFSFINYYRLRKKGTAALYFLSALLFLAAAIVNLING